MESFYVLSHKGKFVFDVKFDPEAPAFKKLVMPTSQLSSAKRFETLCEALEFNVQGLAKWMNPKLNRITKL